jgi:DegV family protein with EDD domain
LIMAKRPDVDHGTGPLLHNQHGVTGRVAVVTDSTAYLPAQLLAGRAIWVVPLHVVIDGRSLVEGADVRSSDLAQALRQHKSVTTSRPSPASFLDVYEQCAKAGAPAVVSVHLSGELSGTADAARLAAHDAPVPVTVVDSRSVGMGLGFAVCTAAHAAARGLTADEVADAASDRAARTSTLLMVDTLEYLRRGGRVTATSAMVGNALAIKPVLQVIDGRVTLLDKVRTTARAMTRMIDAAAEHAGSARVDVAVHHLGNRQRAQALERRLRGRIENVQDLVVSEVGAVIGAHIGPGALGVVISPRS